MTKCPGSGIALVSWYNYVTFWSQDVTKFISLPTVIEITAYAHMQTMEWLMKSYNTMHLNELIVNCHSKGIDKIQKNLQNSTQFTIIIFSMSHAFYI